MDGRVSLNQVAMRFGDFTAIQPTSLEIESGEFFSFLGPSGCGKTTLLNLISGFLTPSEGSVAIGGTDMTRVPVNRRPTAMIFQNLALFPLMSVYQNIEFGLEVRGIDRRERRRRADELLELVALVGSGDKPVVELSGGQKQRIAIARALAVEPRVLLLDEPLSALDLKLRQHMRTELKAIQRKTGITFIYITHDQGEALTMSDRVAVMSEGRIQQVADPMTLYRQPATDFVANFVGETNCFPGCVTVVAGEMVTLEAGLALPLIGRSSSPLKPGDEATLYVRPEQWQVGGINETHLPLLGVVRSEHFEGAWLTLEIALDQGPTVRAHVPHAGAGVGLDDQLAVGDVCRLDHSPHQAIVLPGAKVEASREEAVDVAATA
ncbi:MULTISPECIES: ABC transporter ATP-binding protein [Salinicola]|uniref:ABC transporter ATP-binding protein n=1 Tax=Salinicola socius TaxID=404433 RepID=A0A1Q8SNP9_9GAMM|nr:MULTISPECIES: ABC transporter ATP-binding protein [Salinicola]OLO03055.1 ABC transporter ATP-binding protein [Salinicola socius]